MWRPQHKVDKRLALDGQPFFVAFISRCKSDVARRRGSKRMAAAA